MPRKIRNTVPKNNNVIQNSQSHARSSLETIPVLRGITQTSRFQVLHLQAKMCLNIPKQIPRSNTQENNKTIQVRNEANSSPQPLRKRGIQNIEERGVREREKIEMNLLFMMRAGPVRMTQSTPQAVDPISSMRTAVYPPLKSVGNSAANENSPFQIGLESSRNLGLYKPTAPDPNQDTWAYNFEANSSEVGPPPPTRTFAANSSGSGKRTEIIYPFSRVGDALMCV